MSSLDEKYKQLEALIEDIDRLESEADNADYDADTMVLTDWFVVIAKRGFSDKGQGASAVGYISNGNVAIHSILGMLDFLRVRYHARVASDDD